MQPKKPYYFASTHKKKPLKLALLAFACSSVAPYSFAQNDTSNSNTQSTVPTEIKNIISQPKDQVPDLSNDIKEQPPELPKKSVNKFTPLSIKQLSANPRLFTGYMNKVMAENRITELKRVLPHYKKLPNKDEFLVNFAEAKLYRLTGQKDKAIAIYQKMLKKDPSLNPVRLSLALAHMNARQYMSAKKEFHTLQSTKLPANVTKIINDSLIKIQKLEEWQFTAGGNYIRDDNINNASTNNLSNNGLNSAEPITAHGLNIRLGASKREYIADNFYNTFRANVNAKAYFKESDYNDYVATLSTAYGYDDIKNNAEVDFYYKKRFYDEKAYSDKFGVSTKAGRWVTPKLKLSASAGVGRETHDDQKNKNRDNYSYILGLNAYYPQSRKQYFYGGLSHYISNADNSSIVSYDMTNAYVGWGRSWAYGISSALSASYADKRYDDPAKDFSGASLNGYYATLGGVVGTKRNDKTKSLALRLWHRDFSLYGFTPKLVLSYNQTDSNFLYYDDRSSFDATVVFDRKL